MEEKTSKKGMFENWILNPIWTGLGGLWMLLGLLAMIYLAFDLGELTKAWRVAVVIFMCAPFFSGFIAWVFLWGYTSSLFDDSRL